MLDKLGPEIRLLRQQKGLTQREVASLVQVTPGSIAHIELGLGGAPSEGLLRKLAEVLSADSDRLLALAGKLPADVRDALVQHPELWPSIRVNATR